MIQLNLLSLCPFYANYLYLIFICSGTIPWRFAFFFAIFEGASLENEYISSILNYKNLQELAVKAIIIVIKFSHGDVHVACHTHVIYI